MRRHRSRSGTRFARLGLAVVLPWLGMVACAYSVRGVIDGTLVRANAPGAPPAATTEPVRFTWQSDDGGLSGEIQTALPSGEVFMGEHHQIVSTTSVHHMGGFCGAWYGGPWAGPGWYGGWYGGAWPYHRSCDGFITYYTGQVVAMLTGDRGTRMRCHFHLDAPQDGMRGGGFGECQVSSGERITAMFDRGDVQRVRP